MKPSADAIATIMQRERMLAAGLYDPVKSTPSRMDNTNAHVLEYKSY